MARRIGSSAHTGFRARTSRRVFALVVLLLSSLIASCSSIQFAYNQLDRWMRWQIDDFVDLSAQQDTQLRVALDSFHQWHRKTQLPLYADYFSSLAAEVQQGTDLVTRLDEVESKVDKFWQTSSTQLYDIMLPLTASLTPEQVNEIAAELEDKRQDSLRKWQKSPEKIEQRRRKQIRKQSERWLGSLSAEQEQLIADWVHQVGYNPLLRDQQRRLWQANFVDILRRRPDDYQQQLLNLMQDPQRLWSEEYRQLQAERERQARILSERILSTISERQRQHLVRTLNEYAHDFRVLSAQ